MESSTRERIGSDLSQMAAFRQNARAKARKLARSLSFQLIMMFLTVVNAAVIGVEVEISYGESAKAFPVLDRIFAAVFLLEILIRLWGEGRQFFSEEVIYWNLF